MLGESDMPMFRSLCAKVIPADTDAAAKAMIEAMVAMAIETTHENGTPEGTEAAVLESVKGAFDALERGLYPARAKARALFRRLKAEGRLPEPLGPEHAATLLRSGHHDMADMLLLTHPRGIEGAPQNVTLLPVSALTLLKGGCWSAVEDAGGVRHHCSLAKDHEGAHHDPTTGGFWSVASGNAVLMSKPGEDPKP